LFGSKRLAEIEQDRQRLVTQSGELRQYLAAEGAELRVAASWIETGYSVARLMLDWWPLIATGAGFLMTRKRRGWLRLFARALSLWRIVKRLFPFWKVFFAEPAKDS